MSDKTITQLALDAGVETGGTENALAILKFAKAYADQELKKPNDFIRDIAKFLGEDGLGLDGISWTADDFKTAIDQEKRSTAIAFVEWMQYLYIPYQMKEGLYYHRNDLLKDISQAKVLTTAQIFDTYINSL